MSKDELFDAIWPDVTVTEDSLTQCVSELRRALGRTAQRSSARSRVGVTCSPLRSWTWSLRPPGRFAALSDRPSLAVLPFANLSSDPEQDFFAAGMTEDLTAALSLIRELLVVSRGAGVAAPRSVGAARAVARDVGRALPPRRQRPRGGRAHAGNGAASRQRDRRPRSGPSASTASRATSSPSRTRSPGPSPSRSRSG